MGCRNRQDRHYNYKLYSSEVGAGVAVSGCVLGVVWMGVGVRKAVSVDLDGRGFKIEGHRVGNSAVL